MYRHLRTKLHTTSRIFSPLPGNRRQSRYLDLLLPDDCRHSFPTSPQVLEGFPEVRRRDEPEVVFRVQFLRSLKNRPVTGDESVYPVVNARRQMNQIRRVVYSPSARLRRAGREPLRAEIFDERLQYFVLRLRQRRERSGQLQNRIVRPG